MLDSILGSDGKITRGGGGINKKIKNLNAE
jgi:hypothetical protein